MKHRLETLWIFLRPIVLRLPEEEPENSPIDTNEKLTFIEVAIMLALLCAVLLLVAVKMPR